ncbi:MAG: beta-ketoacyl-[acyl-carrier-protein] synthase II [Elusimicrobia bacterium RIFCSPLOWO2_01_FULL_59_12]|nr:MAG: beta-ketoacyl-[acyl-carrier-protein] synthase II [Elusimicrobia bacterium RIFCSPLOWO2_01_FULL_59_12]
MKRRVVITGMGVISPIGIGNEAYWDALKNGRSGVARLTFFDASTYSSKIDAEVKGFQPELYIDKKNIRRMDRFTQFACAAADMAVKDAGLDTAKLDMDRVGVIVGSGIGGLSTIEEEYDVLKSRGANRVSPFLIPRLISNIAPGEIAIKWGFTGPNYAVSSACATSNNAIGDALRLLRYGDADLIVAGGSEAAITPLGFAGFCSARTLSCRNDEPERASRPFDKDRDGFVMAEGAGIVVLEGLEHARARGAKIYAELAGYGATDDAYHITTPNPEATSAIKAMQRALADGDAAPESVQYVNAHGTSTLLNDKTETKAIRAVFGKHADKLAISATKSMTGHLLGAAGVVELIATVDCINSKLAHPTINYETPDPECDLDYVPNKARPMDIDCALSNSLGFGGHNAVLVVKRYAA